MPFSQNSRGMLLSGGATGAAGVAIEANFTELGNRIGKCNYTATIDPTVANDTTQKYWIGSLWLNATTNRMWQCADATAGAAIWVDYANSLAVSSQKLGIGYGLAAGIAGVRHIVAGIDSLTAGSPTNGESYLKYLTKRLYSIFGFGGAGYLPFDPGTASWMQAIGAANAACYTVGSGWITLSGGTITNVPAKYAPFGFGWSVTGDGSQAAAIDPDSDWDVATIFYLRQSGGGTFNYQQGTGPVTAVNTAGSLGLQSVTVTADKTQNSQLGCNTISGSVVLCGILFACNNSGVMVTNVGYGGRPLGTVAGLDATAQRAWWTAVAPSLFILNGGMNDRTTVSAPAFATNLSAVAGNATTGSPNTQILLIDPGPTEDEFTSNLNGYHAQIQALAQTNGWGYVSNRNLFGNSAAAIASGVMSTGNVHPTVKGNQQIAAHVMNGLGVSWSGATTAPYGFGQYGDTSFKSRALTVPGGGTKVWQDTGGLWRWKSSTPTSATDGQVINPQLRNLCVAAYKFNNTVNDASGRGNTLTVQNSAGFTTGKLGNGLAVVRAANKFASRASSSDLVLAGKDFTISAWFLCAATNLGTAVHLPIMAKGADGTHQEFSIFIDGSGANKLVFFLSTDGTNGNYLVASTFGSVVANTWYHVLAWYDAAKKTQYVTINNGVPNSVSTAQVFNGTGTFAVGNDPSSGQVADGTIDSVAIFTSLPGQGGILNSVQRAALFNDGDGLEWPF